MTTVVAACSLVAGIGSLVLMLRLRSANHDASTRLRLASAPDDFPQRVLRSVCRNLDAGLLAPAGPGGLNDLEVRTREQRDPYRTAAELIDWLAKAAAMTDYHEVCGVIKGVYQLGHVLRSPENEVQSCLEPLIARIKAANVGGTPVARVESIRPGALLDPGTMAPLNYGSRVKQPLGVLVYDVDGKVLGKAKVLCG
jgi:hypothetical protein